MMEARALIDPPMHVLQRAQPITEYAPKFINDFYRLYSPEERAVMGEKGKKELYYQWLGTCEEVDTCPRITALMSHDWVSKACFAQAVRTVCERCKRLPPIPGEPLEEEG